MALELVSTYFNQLSIALGYFLDSIPILMGSLCIIVLAGLTSHLAILLCRLVLTYFSSRPASTKLSLRGLPPNAEPDQSIESTLYALKAKGFGDPGVPRLISRLKWWYEINRFMELLPPENEEVLDSVVNHIQVLLSQHQLDQLEVEKDLVRFICDKAVGDPANSHLYARLCQRLTESKIDWTLDFIERLFQLVVDEFNRSLVMKDFDQLRTSNQSNAVKLLAAIFKRKIPQVPDDWITDCVNCLIQRLAANLDHSTQQLCLFLKTILVSESDRDSSNLLPSQRNQLLPCIHALQRAILDRKLTAAEDPSDSETDNESETESETDSESPASPKLSLRGLPPNAEPDQSIESTLYALKAKGFGDPGVPRLISRLKWWYQINRLMELLPPENEEVLDSVVNHIQVLLIQHQMDQLEVEKDLVRVICDKAVGDPANSHLYARLCQRLTESKIDWTLDFIERLFQLVVDEFNRSLVMKDFDQLRTSNQSNAVKLMAAIFKRKIPRVPDDWITDCVNCLIQRLAANLDHSTQQLCLFLKTILISESDRDSSNLLPSQRNQLLPCIQALQRAILDRKLTAAEDTSESETDSESETGSEPEIKVKIRKKVEGLRGGNNRKE